MYVSAISMRLLRGRSTPAMRAILILLTLTLLVLGVAADDANDALTLDGLALGADRLDGSSYFHGSFTQWRQSALRLSRRARWVGENQWTLLRDRDFVLEVRRHRAFFGHGCPVVV